MRHEADYETGLNPCIVVLGEGISSDERDILVNLTAVAKNAHAFPHQSGFEVKTAGLTSEGKVVLGANQEQGLSHAWVHAETAVISQIKSRYGDVGVRALAFYFEDVQPEDTSVSSCGNCRDVIGANASPDMLIAAGNQNGLKITRFRELLMNRFAEINPEEVGELGKTIALRGLELSIDVYLPKEEEHLARGKNYGTALIGKNGSTWRGGLYTNAGYDAVTPAESAVITWWNTIGDPGRPVGDLSKIVIATYGDVNNVLYRDRQAAMELDEALRAYNQREEPLAVEIVSVDPESKEITKAVRTDTVEWMPHAFSPGTFGMEEAIQDQVAKIRIAADLTANS